MTPIVMPKRSRRDLLREVATLQAMNQQYLQALGALIVQQGGEIRIARNNFGFVYPETIVRCVEDPVTRDAVLTIVDSEAA